MRAQPDSGATPVLAAMLLGIIVLLGGMVAVLVLGGATSERRQSQSAADAAALAAMDITATAWMEILREGFSSEADLRLRLTDGMTPCSGSSLLDAQLLAQRNNANLEQCAWNPASGEVSVRVVATGSNVSDARARAQARAALTVDLRSCTLSGDVAEPPPTPPPGPDPDPDPEPEPDPEPVTGWLTCGPHWLEVRREADDEIIRVIPPGQVQDDFTQPALVS